MASKYQATLSISLQARDLLYRVQIGFPLLSCRMKLNRYFTMLAVCAIAFALFSPDRSREDANADAKASAAVVQDILAQQKTIADNQTKVDAQLAELAEQIRVARLFISRGR